MPCSLASRSQAYHSSNQNLHWKVGIHQSPQCTDLSLAEWLITFTNDLLKNQTIKQLQLELDDEKKKYIQVSEQLDSNDRLVQMLLQDISRMEKKASEVRCLGDVTLWNVTFSPGQWVGGRHCNVK